MFYTTDTDRHGLPHDPFKAIVAPRPIGWISTRAADGASNLAPYSFFNALSDDPKLVMFASGSMKHSAAIAIETGEFVANLATEALADAVNRSSAPAPRGSSEFAIAGVTEAPCRLVSAPRVLESPAALECRVTQHFTPQGLDGRNVAATIVIGQVVAVHIADAVLRDGMIDMGLVRPLCRLGYLDYAVAADVFRMPRPKRPDAADLDRR